MKKFIYILIAVAIILSCCCACSSQASYDPSKSAISSVNLMGGGYVGYMGSTSFIGAKDTYMGIRKLNRDGYEAKKLLSASASYINVTPGWIYYCDALNNNRIMKARSNGSDIQTLNRDVSSCVNVVGDTIYYYAVVTQTVFSMDINGGNRKALFNSSLSLLYYTDGYLYYLDINNSSRLTRYCIETGETEVVSDVPMHSYCFYGENIYYLDKEKMHLHAINATLLDTNNVTTLYDDESIVNFIVVGDYFYLIMSSAKQITFLARLELDGSNYAILTMSYPYNLCTNGEELYYYSRAYDNAILVYNPKTGYTNTSDRTITIGE
ncbi:MAG: DUF5050 domain-containing protein [Clostridiales bacterium]|nr:DUF5050 domain-containing protein [Clostridiales bacterium]